MSEEKTKMKRIRGFPGVVKAQLDPLNQNDVFKAKFKDKKFKILLNTTDGKLAAVVSVEKGAVDVDMVDNSLKESIEKKTLGWNGKIETRTPLFLEIALGKLSMGGIVKNVLSRKVKLKGIRNLLKLLKLFSIISSKEEKKEQKGN